MHDVVASDVALDVDDLSDPADIVAASDEASVSNVVLDPLGDLVLVEVVLDGVSLFNFGVGETDSPSVVGDDVGNLVGTDTASLHLQELELNRLKAVR